MVWEVVLATLGCLAFLIFCAWLALLGTRRDSDTAPLDADAWEAFGECLGGLRWNPTRHDYGELQGRIQGLLVRIWPEKHTSTQHESMIGTVQNYRTCLFVSHPTPVTAMHVANHDTLPKSAQRLLEKMPTGDPIFDAQFSTFGVDNDVLARLLTRDTRTQLQDLHPNPLILDTRGVCVYLPTARPTRHEIQSVTERLIRLILTLQRLRQRDALAVGEPQTVHHNHSL